MKLNSKLNYSKKINLMQAYSERSEGVFLFSANINNVVYIIKKLYHDNNVSTAKELIDLGVTELLFDKVLNISIHRRKDLYPEEESAAFDLVKEGILNKDFTTSSNNIAAFERLIVLTKYKIKKELKKVYQNYMGISEGWLITDETNQQLKEYIKIFTFFFLENKKIDSIIEQKYKEKIKNWQTKEIADIELNNNAVYILNFQQNIDDIIESKEFFKVHKYELSKRRMSVNGEYLNFRAIEKNRKLSDVSISNHSSGNLTSFTDYNNFLFFTEEEALTAGKEKLELLKRAMNQFEIVSF